MLDVYIVHYSPLADRKLQIDECPIISRLSPKYVTEDHITPNLSLIPDKDSASILVFILLINLVLIKYDSKFIRGLFLKALNHSQLPERLDENYQSILNVQSIANLELIEQHFYCIQNFCNSDDDLCIILEDDSYVSEYYTNFKIFQQDLNEIISDLPLNEPIFCDMSNSLNISMLHNISNSKHIRSRLLHEVLPGQTQCVSAYLINKSAAKIISKVFEKSTIFLPVDYLISYILCIKTIRTFWCNYPFFKQGSMDGKTESMSIDRSRD